MVPPPGIDKRISLRVVDDVLLVEGVEDVEDFAGDGLGTEVVELA
jgi:hypothetical protein